MSSCPGASAFALTFLVAVGAARIAAERLLPAPLGGPPLKPNEALVTVSYQSFCYEAVIVLKGTLRTISGQVSSPLGRHDVLVSPSREGYTVVLKASPSDSTGIAAWKIDVDAFTGQTRCTRSPRGEGALGRISVADASGRIVCELGERERDEERKNGKTRLDSHAHGRRGSGTVW